MGCRWAGAAAIVRGFLEDRPDLPPRLRGKLLQAADPLFRAAAIGGRVVEPGGNVPFQLLSLPLYLVGEARRLVGELLAGSA